MSMRLKRAHDPPDHNDGARFLVDRLWPRGLSRGKLRIDQWLPDLAPSDHLRKWFAHDPAKWQEFKRLYAQELNLKEDLVAVLAEKARSGTVTLIYSARDVEHNNAIALKDYVQRKLATEARPTS